MTEPGAGRLEERLRQGLAAEAEQHHPAPAALAFERLMAEGGAMTRRRGPNGQSWWKARFEQSRVVVGAAVAVLLLAGVAVASILVGGAPRSVTAGHSLQSGRPAAPSGPEANGAAGAAPGVFPSAGGPTGAAQSEASGAGASSSGAGVSVTESQDGATVSLVPGETLLVSLGDGSMQWSVPRSADPAVLVLLEGSTSSEGGAWARFRASSPGTTTVSAQGRPRCRAGSACSQLVRWWSLTVRVSP